MERNGQAEPPGASRRWVDPSPHTCGFLRANGIKLNYLDWHGRGPPLILIHGFADNPHIFDDFAPRFTSRFRVIAYARRGHGLSDALGPYDTKALTEDLRGVMDWFRIETAHLAGHSMGGNEITAMAGTHPDRVGGIVYLDAAYDWTDELNRKAKPPPVRFRPPPSAMRSIDAHRNWVLNAIYPELQTARWFDAYLRDYLVVQANGLVRIRKKARATEALSKFLQTERKDYEKVRAPALAIYASTFLDPRCKVTKGGDLRGWERKYGAPFRKKSILQIRRDLPGVKILRVTGTHMGFFTTSENAVVGAMRRFLGTVPC